MKKSRKRSRSLVFGELNSDIAEDIELRLVAPGIFSREKYLISHMNVKM